MPPTAVLVLNRGFLTTLAVMVVQQVSSLVILHLAAFLE